MTKLIKITVILALSAFACGLPTLGAPPPGDEIAVSSEAAKRLEGKVGDVRNSGGDFTLLITEEEMTSLVALRLAETPNAPLSGLQIFLRDGAIEIRAVIDVEGVSTNLQVILIPSVNADGQMQLEATEGVLGPLRMPDDMLTQLTITMDSYLSIIDPARAGNAHLSSITIADGEMTLIGTVGQ